jgi:hypothetical protein
MPLLSVPDRSRALAAGMAAAYGLRSPAADGLARRLSRDSAKLACALQSPERLAAFVTDQAAVAGGRETGISVEVFGALDQRLILFERDADADPPRHTIVSFGEAIGDLRGLQPVTPSGWTQVWGDHVAAGVIPSVALDRLHTPHTVLIALYHAENFPLPRFPLGISDMAYALRKEMMGRVTLLDMQLGATVASIMADLRAMRPDIIGISATFGQHDLLVTLLNLLHAEQGYAPRIVVGGSLAALNADVLLDAYPDVLVASGTGEGAICDVVRHWRGDIALNALQHMTLNAGGMRIRTPKKKHDGDILPDLDLLAPILADAGVMQLESSRGCSYACSFCPREHKGIWVGEPAATLERILPTVAAVFDEHPSTARKIFLVDEEFVGYRADADGMVRALDVAGALQKFSFRFETSARIDQIYRPGKNRAWHISRMQAWRELVERGVDRCLFGIESGVGSILERFNKKTTVMQNVLGLRLLSALGVPRRYTYIVFDPLMTVAELEASYEFLGRSDLILQPLHGMDAAEIFDGVQDETFVRRHARATPFYEEVSYMLVSMEALIGSPYLAEVEAAGLAGAINANMGRKDAAYREPAIGVMSHYSQMWVDRSFRLDYLLKSLEKIAARSERESLHGVRLEFRRAAYNLLGEMLALGASGPHDDAASLTVPMAALLDRQFSMLVCSVAERIDNAELTPESASRLAQEVDKWRTPRPWRLIN